ncbi:amidohydrolase family protein [Nocardia vinacea]|uniref:amidohydrolase family protein n=1 Tax=Nocardia vinacea TaxID=96468 RepID=UPI00343622A5
MSSDATPLVSPLPHRYARLRIDAAFVYTADPNRPVIADGSVLIGEETILAVGTSAQVDDFERDLPAAVSGRTRRIDARDRMVLPGLINDHWHEASALRAHAGMTVQPDDADTAPSPFSNGADMRAVTVLFDNFRVITSAMPQELAYLAALQSLVSELRSGTTTVGDFGSINRPNTLATATLQTGIRAVVTSYGIDGVCRPGENSFVRTRDTAEVLDQARAVLDRYNRHSSGLLRAMPSILSGMSTSDELMLGASELAEAFDTPIATHLAATATEGSASREIFGCRPVERWHRLGVLSSRVVSAHTAFADDDELDWLLDAGVHITHSPQRYGATGENVITTTRQILRLLSAEAPVSLSTDGDPLPLGGMPESMRMGWLAYNEAAGDSTVITPMRALSMATLRGAEALGWQDEIGSLTVGKKADLITVPINDFRYVGMRRPLQAFLSAGGSGDIDMVIVDGRVLVEARELTFIDERELAEAFMIASTEFARALGADIPQNS